MKYVYTDKQIQQALDEALLLGGYSIELLDDDMYSVKHCNLSLIIDNENAIDNSITVNYNELIELALKGLILYFKEVSEDNDNSKEITPTKISHLNQIIDILSSQLV